jgi:hypothetical protein
MKLVPLGKGPELVSARDFYDQLWQNVELERQSKRQNQLSDLHNNNCGSVKRLKTTDEIVTV